MRSRLPGSDRAYVKLDGPFSYQSWAKGVRDGRAIVTNGPMIELSVGDKTLGDTLRLPAPGEVAVRGTAAWQSPLERAELIYNGEVAATAALSSDGRAATLETRVKIGRSGWLSFRASDGKGAQAHTSAVYLEVAGRPTGSRKDAEHFLGWIDRVEVKLRQRDRLPSPAIKARVQAQIDAARAVYRRIAAR